MRQKTLIAALVFTALCAGTFAAQAETEIFNRPNKDKTAPNDYVAPQVQQPQAEEPPATMQGVPDSAIASRAKKLPRSTPGAVPDQALQKQPCSKEDSELILQMDKGVAEINKKDEPNPAEPGKLTPAKQRWLAYMKDPTHIKQMIALYTRCSAFLYQYKEAQKNGGKPVQPKPPRIIQPPAGLPPGTVPTSGKKPKTL